MSAPLGKLRFLLAGSQRLLSDVRSKALTVPVRRMTTSLPACSWTMTRLQPGCQPQSTLHVPRVLTPHCSGLTTVMSASPLKKECEKPLLAAARSMVTPRRDLIKFSLRKGKRKTVRPVVDRFFRLRWGRWIRPRVGRNKKLWKKSGRRQWRLRQHVFVTARQGIKLDKMVTKFWKRPKYYVDDIYEPYHKRHLPQFPHL
ncbi:PREDICTED: 39S ribosomal protein L35, mitochondrial-like [Priapulus caudatus]|uniref:Large ribosomal subunit protein bL35m n=1 Tax=Priapulus caudatus TaxID=37621 RepID=A0ABM1E2G4_PRICU|nr:PREDICTED: 39S ribosomal protein L35, mitochondrial-like [Priapulus caudatus]